MTNTCNSDRIVISEYVDRVGMVFVEGGVKRVLFEMRKCSINYVIMNNEYHLFLVSLDRILNII